MNLTELTIGVYIGIRTQFVNYAYQAPSSFGGGRTFGDLFLSDKAALEQAGSTSTTQFVKVNWSLSNDQERSTAFQRLKMGFTSTINSSTLKSADAKRRLFFDSLRKFKEDLYTRKGSRIDESDLIAIQQKMADFAVSGVSGEITLVRVDALENLQGLKFRKLKDSGLGVVRHVLTRRFFEADELDSIKQALCDVAQNLLEGNALSVNERVYNLVEDKRGNLKPVLESRFIKQTTVNDKGDSLSRLIDRNKITYQGDSESTEVLKERASNVPTLESLMASLGMS